MRAKLSVYQARCVRTIRPFVKTILPSGPHPAQIIGVTHQPPPSIDTNKTLRPRSYFLPCQTCLPCRRARRTLGSQSLVAPLRTSHPSGSRPARLAAAGPWLRWQPQKTCCSPPCPFKAIRQADRTGLWLCTSAVQPLVAHGAQIIGSGLSLSYIDLQSNHGKAFAPRIRTRGT